jgi:hypothetical protein
MATRGRRPLDPLIKSPLSHIDFAAHFCGLEGKGSFRVNTLQTESRPETFAMAAQNLMFAAHCVG